jgi:hypothetical protein
VKGKPEFQRFRNKIKQVNQLMKQFEQMSKMMKMMQGQEEKPHEDDDGGMRNAWRWRDAIKFLSGLKFHILKF